MNTDELGSGNLQQASGLISVRFPATLRKSREAATALLTLLRSLGVTAKLRQALDDTRVLIRI
jgi:hypothetical protein